MARRERDVAAIPLARPGVHVSAGHGERRPANRADDLDAARDQRPRVGPQGVGRAIDHRRIIDARVEYGERHAGAAILVSDVSRYAARPFDLERTLDRQTRKPGGLGLLSERRRCEVAPIRGDARRPCSLARDTDPRGLKKKSSTRIAEPAPLV